MPVHTGIQQLEKFGTADKTKVLTRYAGNV
jgi:hypothetical protein